MNSLINTPAIFSPILTNNLGSSAALLLEPHHTIIPSSLTHLLIHVPRLPSGTMSHRDAYPSL